MAQIKMSPLQRMEGKHFQRSKNHTATSLYQIFQEDMTGFGEFMDDLAVANLPGFINFYKKYIGKKQLGDNSSHWFHWTIKSVNTESQAVLIDWMDSECPLNQPTKTARPGLGNSNFRLVFDHSYFGRNDVIYSHDPRNPHLIVTEEPRQYNDQFIYTVALYGNADAKKSFPLELLEPGEYRFMTLGSPRPVDFSDHQSTFGGFEGNTGAKLYNRMTLLRKDFTASNAALYFKSRKNDDCPYYYFPLGNNDMGGTDFVYADYATYAFVEQFMKEKMLWLMFGRSNNTFVGGSGYRDRHGYLIESGAGIYEQIERANTQYYSRNNFNPTVFVKAITDLYYGTGIQNSDIKIVITTGKLGYEMFNRSIGQIVDTSGLSAFDSLKERQITGTNIRELNVAERAYRTYTTFDGTVIEVVKDPMFDDISVFGRDKVTGYSPMSDEFMVLNFTRDESGDYGIYEIEGRAEDRVLTYSPSWRDPIAKKPHQNSSWTLFPQNGKDQTIFSIGDSLGAMVTNPRAHLIYKPY